MSDTAKPEIDALIEGDLSDPAVEDRSQLRLPGMPSPEEIEKVLAKIKGESVVKDRKLRRIRFKNPAAVRAWNPPIEKLINDYILGHKDRALTYMSLAFARIRLIDDAGIARVVLNRHTRRFEMHLNIRRIRGFHIAMMLKRAGAPRFPSDRVKLEPIDVDFETVEQFDTSVARTLDKIILHEFGHLWFKHLKYEDRKAPPEIRPFLNIATDSLVNFHLKVNLGLHKLHDRPITDGIMAVTPILFPMMQVNYARFEGMSKRDILKLCDDTTLSEEEYTHWRVIASQLLTFKPQGLAAIRDAVVEIQGHARAYTATITEIATKIANLFPEKPKIPDSCVSRGHGHGSRRAESETRGADGGADDDFIDLHDIPPEEIPPHFDEVLPSILAGRGGAVMTKMIAEARDIKASKRVIAILNTHAERDPGKFIIQSVGKVVVDRARSTFRPTKRPILASIALTNSFARSDPARFRVTRTTQDKIAGNKLDVYVDVSGSFSGYFTKLYPFLRDLARAFNVTAWQFSTVISPLTRTHLEEGIVTTTDGTDGNAILTHMRQRFEQGVRKFTVLGDRIYGDVHVDLLNFPDDVWVIDMLVGHQNTEQWFQEAAKLHVMNVRLNRKFEVEKESGEEDD